MTQFMMHKDNMDVCLEPSKIVPGVSVLLVQGRWLNIGFEGVPQYITPVESVKIQSEDWKNWKFMTEEELVRFSNDRRKNG